MLARGEYGGEQGCVPAFTGLVAKAPALSDGELLKKSAGGLFGSGLVCARRYRLLNALMVAGTPFSYTSFGSPSMSGRKYASASSVTPW